MYLDVENNVTVLEEAEKWYEVLQFLYDKWKADAENWNVCACACFEYWYIMTCFDPQAQYAKQITLSECYQRLNEMAAYGLKHFYHKAAFCAILGYCITLFPYFFSELEDCRSVNRAESFGMRLIDRSKEMKPDDQEIAAIHAIIHGASYRYKSESGELKKWKDAEITSYFMSIISSSNN